MNGKPNQTPIPPQEGFKEDPYARCGACHSLLVVQNISVVINGIHNPVAKIHLCGGCKRIAKRWIVQGFYVDDINGRREHIDSIADKYKISKDMIANCMATHPGIYSFTMAEIKENSAPVVKTKSYNPDMYIEPVVDEPLF